MMRTGGYFPSVDHQTPPEVSLANYRIYMRLFREYMERATREHDSSTVTSILRLT
ncbi:MAG: hypothetical protein IT582_08250 [Opitutaceae bacterium]|nr:hypothetical protein [Opitutaceae bacterium]